MKKIISSLIVSLVLISNSQATETESEVLCGTDKIINQSKEGGFIVLGMLLSGVNPLGLLASTTTLSYAAKNCPKDVYLTDEETRQLIEKIIDQRVKEVLDSTPNN